jgi:hypothetical protein
VALDALEKAVNCSSLCSMVSMMNILPCALCLAVDVRHRVLCPKTECLTQGLEHQATFS